IEPTWVISIRLWPRIGVVELSGGALNQTNNATGASAARMAEAMTKLIRIASDVCLKDNPEPSSCANIPLMTPLPAEASKLSNGTLMGGQRDWSGPRQIPTVKP